MSFYDATVPAFQQILGALSGILTKAEAHCTAKNIQPDVLLGARLYPDMLPLSRQIQLACDFAGKGCARLAHIDVPSTPDTDQQPADACAICAVMSLAGNVLFATPPLLQLPQAVEFLYLTTDAEFVHLNSIYPAFQSRAPPAS